MMMTLFSLWLLLLQGGDDGQSNVDLAKMRVDLLLYADSYD